MTRRASIETRWLVGMAMMVALVTVLLLPSVASASAPVIEVGEPFPDLALRTLDGEVSRVSNYRGTKLVLHVFASW